MLPALPESGELGAPAAQLYAAGRAARHFEFHPGFNRVQIDQPEGIRRI